MTAEFKESAFRHGFDESDFYEVLASKPIKRRSQRGFNNVYELFGRNGSGAYLHVIYRREQERMIVFHINVMNEAQRRYYRKHHR